MLPEFIATGDKEEIDRMLGFFLHECPAAMIPTRSDLRQWADALEALGGEFAGDTKACRDWANSID